MKSEIKGVQASGEKVEADFCFLTKGEVSLNDLTQEISGKIIAVGKLGRAVLMKAVALEVAGIVTVDLSEELFAEICHGKDWEIGDSCSLKMTILVIEDSGLSDLADFNAKHVILDPLDKKLILSEKTD